MIRLTYIPVDEEHESAVVIHKSETFEMGESCVKFFDDKVGLLRSVSFDKLEKVEFSAVISKELKNKAVNTLRLQKKNSKTFGSATIK